MSVAFFVFLYPQNRILWIDEKNLTAHVEAGIVGQDLERLVSAVHPSTCKWLDHFPSILYKSVLYSESGDKFGLNKTLNSYCYCSFKECNIHIAKAAICAFFQFIFVIQ